MHYEGMMIRSPSGPVIAAQDPQALDTAYRFLSDEIKAIPGKWWASDLLQLMLPVDAQKQSENEANK